MQTITVGQPFPGPVPAAEGATLDLSTGGLSMVIQAPGLSPAEMEAFRAGATVVCLLEDGPPEVPLCLLIVAWPQPLGPMDMSLDVKRVRPEIVADWLDTGEGTKNALQVILLDGPTVRGLKLMGLPVALVEDMHAIIRRQLAAGYTPAEHDRELARLYQVSTPHLMSRANCYPHRD